MARISLLAVLAFVLGILCVAVADSPPAAATGGKFPAQPFNGMTITYAIEGAELGSPLDESGFTTSRSYRGRIHGPVLRVSGTVKQESGWSASVRVSVQAGGESNSFEAAGDKPWSQDYDVSVPVPEGATTGSVSVFMTGYYNAGTRGLVVSADLDNNAPTQTPSPTASPTSTATPTPTPTPELDIAIGDVEITQAIQCMDPSTGDTRCSDNFVPLVQGKRTAVRVYVKTEAKDGELGDLAFEAVDGRLTLLSSPGGTIEPSRGGPQLTWTVQPRFLQLPNWWLAQREAVSLDFKLPLEATRGDSLRFKVELNPDRTLEETDYSNNDREVNAELEPRRDLTVLYVPVRIHVPGRQPTEPSASIRWYHRTMMKMYPVRYGGINYIPGSMFTYRRPVASDADLGNFMKSLQRKWEMPHVVGAKHSPDQLVGWTAQRVGGMLGYSDPLWMNPPGRGRSVFVIEDAESEPTIAHEIGHNLNQRHPIRVEARSAEACGAWDPGSPWRYPSTLITETGYDPALMKAKNAGAWWDFMTYCHRKPWISPFTYHRLFMEMVRIGPVPPPSSTVHEGPSEMVLVGGTVYRDGRAVLDPLVRVVGEDDLPTPDSDGPYCVELLDSQGRAAASRCFPIDFLNSEYDPVDEEWFFFVMPFPAGTESVRVSRSGSALAERRPSAHPPTVSVDEPAPGVFWDGPRSIRWSAGDADGDNLIYSVLYSPDGDEWLSLDPFLEDRSLQVDTHELPGGGGARIRVYASDGFHTTVAESGPFHVPAKAPSPVIVGPVDGARFGPKDTVALEGSGYDLEDGALDPSTFRWTSDRDGLLGMGPTVDAAGLSEGEHLVSLQARDIDGNTGSDTVVVHVGRFNTYLPWIVKAFRTENVPPVQTSVPQPTDTRSASALARQVVELVNDIRAGRGLGLLAEQAELRGAAEWFAGDMARSNYYSRDHWDRLDRDVAARLKAYGYAQETYATWRVAENIAGGQATAEEVVSDWMASAPHRASILDPMLREIGAGYAYSGASDHGHYWVLDFGHRDTTVPTPRTPGATATPTVTQSAPTPTRRATNTPTTPLQRTPTPTRRATSTPTTPSQRTPTPTAPGATATTPSAPNPTPMGPLDPAHGIQGWVTFKGQVAEAEALTLVLDDGAAMEEKYMAYTFERGKYAFASAATLGSGERYYVKFPNDAGDPLLVAVWYSHDIDTYTAGEAVHGGDFDIANVELLSPSSNSTVRLPARFSWERRDFGSYTYVWALVDRETRQEWHSGDLGDVDSMTLSSMPEGVQYDRDYLWYVWIIGGPDSAGHSYYAHDVRFARGSGPTLTPEPTATQGAVSCRDLIVNGGFEQGPQVGWKLVTNLTRSETGETLVLDDFILHNDRFPDSDPAYQGDWLAYYWPADGAQSVLYQYQPLAGFDPARVVSGTVEFALLLVTDETLDGSPDDTFQPVLIDEKPDGTVQFRAMLEEPLSEESQDEGNWTPYDYNLTDRFWEVAGSGTWRYGFLAENDDAPGTSTAFLLDAATFTVCERLTDAPSDGGTSAPNVGPWPSADPLVHGGPRRSVRALGIVAGPPEAYEEPQIAAPIASGVRPIRPADHKLAHAVPKLADAVPRFRRGSSRLSDWDNHLPTY